MQEAALLNQDPPISPLPLSTLIKDKDIKYLDIQVRVRVRDRVRIRDRFKDINSKLCWSQSLTLTLALNLTLTPTPTDIQDIHTLDANSYLRSTIHTSLNLPELYKLTG
jgi:hypothetical protein